MKSAPHTLVAARMDALFARLPVVSGFSVTQELAVVDLVYEDIADAIGTFLEERPEAAELVRGRTFARTLQ